METSNPLYIDDIRRRSADFNNLTVPSGPAARDRAAPDTVRLNVRRQERLQQTPVTSVGGRTLRAGVPTHHVNSIVQSCTDLPQSPNPNLNPNNRMPHDAFL